MNRVFSSLCVLIATLQLSTVLPAQDDSKPNADGKRVIHEVKLAGPYMDLPHSSFSATSLLSGGGAKPKGFYEMIDSLKELAKFPAAKEVLFDLSDPAFHLNLAQIEEVDRAIESLRKAGAKTTAYIENADMSHYLVACMCDRVALADVGTLDITAPALSILFMKDAFDLLGVQFQVTRAGQFKGAVEPYMLSEMSAHLRAHYLDMVKSMNDRLVAIIGSHRKLDAAKVRAVEGTRLFSAKAAKAAGLIDDLVEWRGGRRAVDPDGKASFEAVPKKKKKEPFNFLALLSGSTKSKKDVTEDSFAVLHLSGEIVDGDKEQPGAIVDGPTVTLVNELRDNPKIKGVVVRVNSPGGSGTASEAILLALRDLAAKKPVVISMGELAASGGYYVSMVGGTVLAEHATITGSIGVFGMRPNMGTLSRRIGLKNEVIALDDAGGMTDVFRPLTDGQLEQIQNHIMEFYERFRGRILEVRQGLTAEKLLAIAGGRVWSGAQALDLGLVDKLGGLDDALAILKEKTGSDLPTASYPSADSNPFGMLEDMFGGARLLDPAEVRVAQAAGFNLTTPLRILADTVAHPSAVRAWMVLPFELRLN